jgi:peroxin-3
LYSITLLCLFTTLQLTLLARSKYVASILEQERDERVREELAAGLTTTNLLFGSLGLGPAAGLRLESLLSGGYADGDDLDGERALEGETWRLEHIDEDAESKYLTLSWWLLHVGWKDVGERVRRAVDETFEGFVYFLCAMSFLTLSKVSL